MLQKYYSLTTDWLKLLQVVHHNGWQLYQLHQTGINGRRLYTGIDELFMLNI